MQPGNDHRIRLDDDDVSGAPSVLIAGDCVVPDGCVSPPFAACFRERIRDADLSVVNLEGSITNDPAPLPKSGPRKHSASRTPEFLAAAGFDGATLANNHTMDYGEAGLLDTIAACHEAGLETLGAGEDVQASHAPLVRDLAGVELAVLNVNEREFGEARRERAGTAVLDHPEFDRSLDAVCREADAVVVVVHAGVEYVPFPPPHLQARYRDLVARGVDLVVGHHPHVPQGWERYGDGLICYSVGNCYFEQPKRDHTDWGLAIEASVGQRGVHSVDLVATEMQHGKVDVCTGPRRAERLAHLRRLAAITRERDRLEAHWQDQALRVFHQRYTDMLTTAVDAGASRLLRHPARVVERDDQWKADDRIPEPLVLLNLLRNDSHRAVLETALEVETGVADDRRTPEIRRTVEQLLERTDNKSLETWPTRLRRMLHSTIDRHLPAPTRENPSS